jgi:hypothetical protein
VILGSVDLILAACGFSRTIRVVNVSLLFTKILVVCE